MTTTRRSESLAVRSDDLTDPSARCSTSSLAAQEAVGGSASTWSACLMVEENGPWGPKVLTDSRLSAELRGRLADLPVRVLLVRRHGRQDPPPGPGRGPVTVMASWSSAEGSWLERTELEHTDDLLHVDLEPLTRGRSLGWGREPDPVLLVCTHGRRDVCCAERGRPVAAALADRHPEATWECSHVGGHRFAANVVVLPEGLAYGRVEPSEAAALGEDWLAGRVSPEHLRGRVHQRPVEQVVETVVRQRLGLVGGDDVVVGWLAGPDDGGDVEVRVEVRRGPYAGRHEVSVRSRTGAGVLASCGDTDESAVTDWEVGALR